MTSPKPDDSGMRHPTLWTVEVIRWEYDKRQSEVERQPAKTGGEVPGIKMGQRIDGAEVPDRPFALAVAHHLLDRHAHDAAGRLSIEIHVYPPEQDVHDENVYEIAPEVLDRAKKLGMEGDVENHIKRMARDAKRYTHEWANCRFDQFIIRVEGNTVTRIGQVEPRAQARKRR